MKSKTDDLILILGPCVIEGEDHAVRMAQRIRGAYLVVNALVAWAGWPWGAAFCVPLIVQRVVIVRRNYKLNVEAW